MKYLEGTRAPEPGCFLCNAAAGSPDRPGPEADRESLVLLRRPEAGAFVIFNKYPYSNGHLMAVPAVHKGKMEELTDAEMLELMRLARDCQAILSEVMRPDGFNVGINLGRAAGAGVPGHLHVHIVPRWSGDTNFMTVTGGVRVIPEDLADTYAKLHAAAGRLGLL
jgi:ATP adenylyltransferase